MNVPDKKSPDSAEDAAQRLIQRLADGNPLLDDDAYERAHRSCTSDAERDLLRAIRDATQETIAKHGQASAEEAVTKGTQKPNGTS